MAAVSASKSDLSREQVSVRRTSTSGRRLFALAGALALALAGAGSAGALDDLSPGQDNGAGGACPALTQIKYPWIACQSNEYGGVTLAMPDQPAPLFCHLLIADGSCAASPEPWQLDAPKIRPGPGPVQ